MAITIESGGKKIRVETGVSQPTEVYRHPNGQNPKLRQLEREAERGKKILNGNNR